MLASQLYARTSSGDTRGVGHPLKHLKEMASMNKMTLATLAVLTTLAFNSQAEAQDKTAAANGYPSVRVQYGDLDLSTVAGAGALYERIRNAAWRVCIRTIPGGNGPFGIERGNCVRFLVDVTVKDVNSATLTALHEKRGVEVAARR